MEFLETSLNDFDILVVTDTRLDNQINAVGKPRTDSVPPTMQSQIPKSRDVTLFFLDMTLYK